MQLLASEPAGENTYFFCRKDGKTVPWSERPPDNLYPNLQSYGYLDGALRELEARIGPSGLTFYVTRNVVELPEYGNHVVAVVVADEWARRPRYSERVRAVFKEYGVELAALGNLDVRRPLLSIAKTAQYVRNAISHARVRGSIRRSPPSTRSTRVFVLPLGYYNQQNLPLVPFAERTIDVSFAGSIAHQQYGRLSLQRYIGTAKSRSREAMLASLERFRQTFPAYCYDLGFTSSFFSIADSEADAYSRRLMHARICLCPRGMSLETYRYFEAMRFGCIIIAEEPPAHWFYEGSPAIVIRDWTRLEQTLLELLENPDRMQALHRAALSWWHDVCSERALGSYMARALQGALSSPLRGTHSPAAPAR